LLNFEPICLGNEQTILISTKNDEIITVDFHPLTSNWVNSYPITWTVSGDKLLLYFRESSDSNPAPLSEMMKGYVIYSPDTKSFDEMDLMWNIIAWSADGSELLMTLGIDNSTLALGWYTLSTQDFQ
jgi:hypothetical protein